MTVSDFGTHRELEERRRYIEPTDCDGRMLVVSREAAIWVIECDLCRFEAGVPAHEIDPARRAADVLSRRRARSGMPPELRGLMLPDGGSGAERAAAAWAACRLNGIVLTGPVGVGKTHTAAAAAAPADGTRSASVVLGPSAVRATRSRVR